MNGVRGAQILAWAASLKGKWHQRQPLASSFERVPNVPHRRLRSAVATALALALALPAGAQAVSRERLAAKAGKAMRKAGPRSGALIRDFTTGEVLFELRPGRDRIPASVEKLYTTAAALRRMGPRTRLNTDVVAAGTVDAEGRLDGDLFIRGGGDPTLGPSDIGALAGQVSSSGLTAVTGSVVGDESRFDARRGGSGWGYSPWLGGSIGALALSRGSGKGGPGLSAARAFRSALRARGMRILGRTRTGQAPAEARRVGRVSSPTVAELARLINVPSDNFMAETLLKELGARFGRSGTTAAGAAVARRVATGFGATPRIVDGSGLSRSNATSPAEVMKLLVGMRSGPTSTAFERSLAVAGQSGTLASRMRGTAAAGRCRAKTGTLSDVSTLAGLCRTASGDTVAFVLMMNGLPPDRGRALQDTVVRGIARYDGS